MDWEQCLICQERTKEDLQCPANSKKKDAGAGYTSFVSNLEEFQSLGNTPTIINVNNLDEGHGREHTLREKKASW